MERRGGDGMSMTTQQNEILFRDWCLRWSRDPELGESARAFEEFLAQQPIEEWWDAMDEEAQEQRRMNDRDGGARL
jgi:hypothetical protein